MFLKYSKDIKNGVTLETSTMNLKTKRRREGSTVETKETCGHQTRLKRKEEIGSKVKGVRRVYNFMYFYVRHGIISMILTFSFHKEKGK